MGLIRVGIIGSKGLLGKRRIKYLENNDYYDIIARCDIKYDKDDGPNDYVDYKKMIDYEDLDAVFICVPHTLTIPISKYCLSKGLHVFAEKPPGVTLEVTKSVKDVIGDKKIMFGFNHRYFTGVLHMIDILDSGELGKIRWVRGVYGRTSISGDQEGWREDKELGGRGILISQGIHMIDLIRWITKSKFDSVKSYINHFEDKWFEDNVMVLMKSTKDNIVASVHSSCVLGRNQFTLTVGCEKGYIQLNGLSMSHTHSFGFPDELTVCKSNDELYIGNPTKEIYYYGDNYSWAREIAMFSTIINQDRKSYTNDLDDAIETMELVEKIYENANDI